jgi:hypothetical protein
MIAFVLAHPWLSIGVWLVSMGVAYLFVFGASKDSGRDGE